MPFYNIFCASKLRRGHIIMSILLRKSSSWILYENKNANNDKIHTELQAHLKPLFEVRVPFKMIFPLDTQHRILQQLFYTDVIKVRK